MKLSITLVHNKSPQDNEGQITALKSLLKEVIDGPFLNEETGETWTTIHHEIIGLDIPHEVKIFQVVPFGVKPPANRYEINSGGIVYYEKGDEDKIGNHPRFFNWGGKRGIDCGVEIVIHLDNPAELNIPILKAKLLLLENPNDVTEFVEEVFGKLSTLKLLKEVGQLDETKGTTQAIIELKQRVLQKGLKNG